MYWTMNVTAKFEIGIVPTFSQNLFKLPFPLIITQQVFFLVAA